jgi:hypothetical protein
MMLKQMIKENCMQLTKKDYSRGKSKTSCVKKIAIGIAALAVVSQSVNAQTETQRIADLERKLQNALATIDKLADKVESMDGSAKSVKSSRYALTTATTPVESKTVAQQNSSIETLQQQVKQLSSASSSSKIIPFDWLHGFADVGGGYSSKGGNPAGFGVGSLDLYIAPKMPGQVRTLAELLFEYDELGEMAVDLERVQLGYAFNDKMTVSLGRFHTPFGYWQTAYHHGQQIQPSLLRPRFIDFEDKGGILPSHTTGVWGTGGIPLSGGKLTYDIYGGNTPRIMPNDKIGNGKLGSLDSNIAGFSNQSLSAGGKLSYAISSGVFDGLSVGVNGMHSQVQIMGNHDIDPLAPSTAKTNMSMAGGYMYYNNHDVEIISEVYGFMNYDPSTKATYDSWAGFVHAGYAIDKWMPYGRIEKADTNQNDVYFNSMAMGYAYSREAAGVRYDVNPQSSLKLELNYTQPQSTVSETLNDSWESRIQYAVRF